MTVEKLITDHIDIWSSALQTRSAAGRGSNGKIDLYGIKKLRELILELAVRGKLVPQDPNDEPASELLKRIAAEKAELVKQGKIKKQKLLPEISEDEKPFELPAGWEWSSIQNLCLLENGDRSKNYPNKSTLTETGIPFVNAGHLLNGKIDEKEMTFIKKSHFETLRSGKFLPGDILFCLRGSLGKSALVENVSGAIASSLVIVRVYPLVNNKYVHFYFDSPVSYQFIKKYDNGTAQPNLAANDLARFLIPVPPVDEQIRILVKIDNLMSLCDQLEQQSLSSLDAHQQLVETLLATLTDSQDTKELSDNWARISQYFGTLFTTEASIDALKQTILQLAVMGKLVPQDPDDEPASELLKRIEQEKAELVKQGKIKKQKPLPPVSDEEKPFELPVGWEWCRIIEIAQVGTGATPSRDNPDYWETPEFNWVTSGETSLPFIFNTAEKISGKAVKETNVSIYSPGTLIIAMYGQGKTRGQITELCISAGTNQACAAIQLFNTNEYHRCYIKLFFEKSYKDLRELAAGGAQPNLNLAKVSNTLVPIPPLSEQIKITCKVEELIKVCDTLKSRLQSAQQTQLHLADALTDAALN
ncbi:restriction endonuclease subunit S [Morganella morganii]|uniref:restriction endonuclease subunit S n=1 Tax=Morganella morganii TaxID=582 RepID=UPI000290E914|nr:restriction endonuclease subunit S [Morganella morganii]AVK35816.1 type I restriction modification DNA specificity domain protein [Morganella morganii]ELO7537691.1 restriction endonuclease subunit S [Morganella morganii]EMP51163.1 Type I restriction-modification system, specificity subunit S [Morganella morganii SC01]MBN4019060.1 restriction endonuclease subunit S [Morganella morganii]MBO8066369.1 restriction endonuclease subunit S [Morganella morganii]